MLCVLPLRCLPLGVLHEHAEVPWCKSRCQEGQHMLPSHELHTPH